jgi:nitroreductase
MPQSLSSGAPWLPPLRRESDLLEKVADLGRLAPSPDNNQPWAFEFRPPRDIRIYYDAGRYLVSDFQLLLNGVALGCCAESMVLAATSVGASAQVEWDTSSLEQACDARSGLFPVAQVTLGSPRTAQRPELAWALIERCSQRRPYRRRQLDAATRSGLSQAAQGQKPCQLHWLHGDGELWELAALVAAAEAARLESRRFHEELFRALRWPKTGQPPLEGLPVEALELPPGGAHVLKFLRNWAHVEGARRLRATQLMGWATAGTLLFSGGAVILSVDQLTVDRMVEAGRVLQRFWIQATQGGLAVHPMASLPVWLARFRAGLLGPEASVSGEQFGWVERRLIRLVPALRRRHPVIVLRVGYAGRPPSYRTRRRPLEQVLLNPWQLPGNLREPAGGTPRQAMSPSQADRHPASGPGIRF